MPGYMVPHDSNHFKKELEGFLDGILDIFRESKGFAFNVRKAGKIVIKLMVWDDDVTMFAKYCGESGETTVADYWGAKALAHAMAGDLNKGRKYFDQSRLRRTGGVFAEWNQQYYS